MVVEPAAETTTSPIIDLSVDAFLDCLPAGAHLGALPQHVTPTSGDVLRILAILAIKHDTAWFAADIRDAPHQLGFGRYVDAGFRVGGYHAMIRHDDDQRVLRHTSTQQRQLGVDTLICADPLVGVPAVIVSDLVRVAQVHVCQSGRVRRFRRGHDTSAWIVIGDVVAAT